MARFIFMIILGIALSVSPAQALTESETAEEYLQRKIFIVETDEQSASESLHRVSGGTFDRGFSSPGDSYQSAHQQSTAGPFSENDSSSLGPGFSY